MNRKQWRKEFKHCESKYTDKQRRIHGNILCGEFLPIGRRCMYRVCPLRIKAERARKGEA